MGNTMPEVIDEEDDKDEDGIPDYLQEDRARQISKVHLDLSETMNFSFLQ
jgi:hypothetical protein